ncbi:hypothetical protein [Nonomuraea sp. NPDC050691]|uniref:hypothetical protein n=1 Tax=Nonomuraea sp. NPDC050691 TaxID=3155661 RepID=UPI0033C6366D
MVRAGFKALAAASGVAVVLVAGAGVAQAQTTRAAVDCVKKVDGGRTITGRPWVKVKNECAWTYDIKIVWKYGPDSLCRELSPGETLRHESAQSATYDGTRIC